MAFGNFANALAFVRRELHALGSGNRGTNLHRARDHCPSISALAQQRLNAAQNAAIESIGKNRLQPVAHFDAIAMILDGEKQHDPLVLALLADTPLPVKRVGDVFNLLAIQRFQRYQRHLHAGGTLHLAGISFQLSARLRIENVREIADVTLRLERFKIEGKKRRTESAQKQRGPRQFAQ